MVRGCWLPPISKAGGPTLVSCPCLFTYLQLSSIFWGFLLHLQPQDAPCHDDMEIHLTWLQICMSCLLVSLLMKLLGIIFSLYWLTFVFVNTVYIEFPDMIQQYNLFDVYALLFLMSTNHIICMKCKFHTQFLRSATVEGWREYSLMRASVFVPVGIHQRLLLRGGNDLSAGGNCLIVMNCITWRTIIRSLSTSNLWHKTNLY